MTTRTAADSLGWPGAAERPANPRPLRKGDIRRVQTLVGLEGPSRLALVVRAPSGRDRAEIMLTHERAGMAGPDDVVLHPESAELPNGLVVQTRLRGIVWRLQLSTFLGRLTPSQMASVASAVTSTRNDQAHTSTALPPEQDDGSWTDFQESELQALRALTGDCADATLDDDGPWRIDTCLLCAECLDRHDDPATILTEVMHILRTRPTVATRDDLEALHASGATDASTWRCTTYGSDLASQIALSVRLLVESSLMRMSDDGTAYSAPGPAILPERSFSTGNLRVSSSERLVTAPFLWADSGIELLQAVHGIDSQPDNRIEVMMLATSESRGPMDHRI